MTPSDDRDRSFRRLAPDLVSRAEFAIWRAKRRRETKQHLSDPAYQIGRSLRIRRGSERPHVVIVPQEGEGFDSFRPGMRNFYYEAAQNLRELIGDDRVSVFSVLPDERPDQWHVRLLDFLLDTGATHLLTHAEHDPGTAGASFTWDTFWTYAAPRWPGVFLGVMFDSAYDWILAGSRHMGRISSRYVVVDICMPMDGRIRRGRPEAGPVNMPVSLESMALVDERLDGVEPSVDVTFIGALYPYRVEMLDAIRSAGVSVAVNPHRPDRTHDLATSRENQPGWLDYMAGLRSGRMTINLSRSSARDVEQLKTRVLEATLAGTVLLTDDRTSTRRWWVEGSEYFEFRDPTDLPRVVTEALSRPDDLAAMGEMARKRARVIAHTDFWGGIEATLARRGLPGIGVDVSASPTLHS